MGTGRGWGWGGGAPQGGFEWEQGADGGGDDVDGWFLGGGDDEDAGGAAAGDDVPEQVDELFFVFGVFVGGEEREFVADEEVEGEAVLGGDVPAAEDLELSVAVVHDLPEPAQ